MAENMSSSGKCYRGQSCYPTDFYNTGSLFATTGIILSLNCRLPNLWLKSWIFLFFMARSHELIKLSRKLLSTWIKADKGCFPTNVRWADPADLNRLFKSCLLCWTRFNLWLLEKRTLPDWLALVSGRFWLSLKSVAEYVLHQKKQRLCWLS